MLLLWGSIAFSQVEDTKSVRFLISPPAETLIVNDSVLTKGNKMDLEPGVHRVRFWTPHYVLIDTVVNVQEAGGRMDFVYFHKQFSQEYASYQNEVKQYNAKKGWNFLLPLSTTLVLTGTTAYTYFATQNRYDEALAAFEDYRFNNRDSRGQAFADFETIRDKYRNGITSFYIQAGMTLVSAYFLYQGFRWKSKNKPPSFKEEKNPLALESVFISPGHVSLPQNSGVSFGLTFSLN